LPGPPRGKGRPRFRIVRPKDRRKPQFVTVYTDKETADYELRLRGAATTAMVGKRVLDEPVTVQIDALMPVPESWPRRAQAEALRGDLCHTAKPDMDNIVKLLDALNEIVWWDDSAVIQTVARKFYHAEPMLIISVWRWL
jgi:Holliday junction resolvase RusA-like endonuclease